LRPRVFRRRGRKRDHDLHVPVLGPVVGRELPVSFHVHVALNLVASGEEVVELRANSRLTRCKTGELRSGAVIAGDLLEVVADEADVDLGLVRKDAPESLRLAFRGTREHPLRTGTSIAPL
jgi:hypothetical protein